ncbi:Putative beta-barrel porin-2, OmpL-like. bbp2 [Arachidicoccus rhizosphaerae]|uniref:Putative beta-barrel porin-2, OmpL-like. bbp2 n=1 Tax=Arachidicoccus rhizosphaerae TaxID=551991 RepID=A0A1H3XW65_9BACT|nr:outer membrane beta-barrel protein [Arachidicoccus rhizosphaerae]SEA03470.1 Putative beta-barrel porin-2, OmpL-like. bbp2 [Arachidicoccus rhizosphaerae]
MKIKPLFLAAAMFCSSWVNAQDSVIDSLTEGHPNGQIYKDRYQSLTLNGNLDVYYKNVFRGTKNATTSFTSKNQSFQLGMASVQLAYQYKKSGVVVDLGFGPRAEDFSYTDQGARAAIKQAYVYYEPVTGLRFSAGTWATHIGYEVLDPALNANYSMSYLFSTGPFSNTGLKAEYSAGNHHLMAGISNPTDYRVTPDQATHAKTLIARYSFEKENGLILALNYSGGKQIDSSKIQQLDAVICLPAIYNISLGWNGSVCFRKKESEVLPGGDTGWKNWWGQALYLNYHLTDHLQLALREEYFTDTKALSPAMLGTHVWSGTATLKFTEGDFSVFPEFRWDKFAKPYGSSYSSQLYGLLAVAYQF